MEAETTGIKHMFAGTCSQLVASLAGAISAVSDGMHYGWSAPTIPILQSENSTIKITKSDENLLETLYLIGGLVAIPATIYLVDKIGRKYSAIVASCLGLVSWGLIVFAPKVIYLHIARFLAGVAADLAIVAVPMYVAEIAHQKIRGFLLGLNYFTLYLGVLFIYVIGPITPLYVPALVGCLILLIQIGSFLFMPESPYYFLAKNKPDSARKALNRVRATEDNKKEFQEMSETFERGREQKGRFLDLVMVKANRKATIITTVLNVAINFCGVSVMLMNMHSILLAAGSVYLSSNNIAILFSVIMLIATICASLVVDKYGRKFLLITSSILTSICLLVLGIYFNLKSIGHDVSPASWIPIMCVMGYAAVFKTGLGFVPLVITAEVYGDKVKAVGMTLQDIAFCVSALLSLEMYNRLSASYGIHIPFYLFAASSVATGVFTALAVPETKGKTLEEIQLLLERGKVVQ